MSIAQPMNSLFSSMILNRSSRCSSVSVLESNWKENKKEISYICRHFKFSNCLNKIYQLTCNSKIFHFFRFCQRKITDSVNHRPYIFYGKDKSTLCKLKVGQGFEQMSKMATFYLGQVLFLLHRCQHNMVHLTLLLVPQILG